MRDVVYFLIMFSLQSTSSSKDIVNIVPLLPQEAREPPPEVQVTIYDFTVIHRDGFLITKIKKNMILLAKGCFTQPGMHAEQNIFAIIDMHFPSFHIHMSNFQQIRPHWLIITSTLDLSMALTFNVFCSY